MRFRQQRHVDRVAAGRGVVEARLIGEDRLAGAGRSLDDVDAGRQQSAVEDAIQTRDPGGPAFGRRRVFGSLQVTPIRSRRLSSRTSRKHDGKTGALAEVAVDRHRAAHRDADVPHNPQADAEAATALLGSSLKALEDLRLLIGRNADAVIAHFDTLAKS